MSAPWWHPEATPLRDIREWMCAAETEHGPPPLLITAPTLRQAEYWAYQQGLERSAWRYAQVPERLAGVNAGVVVVVNGHSLPQLAAWQAQLRVLEASGVVVRRVYT